MSSIAALRGGLAAAVFAAAVISFGISFGPCARAEGALAAGFSGDIVKDGISYGYSVNNEKPDAAVEKALNECRVGKNAPKMAASCKLVTTFKNECIAVAWDPKPGTPGMGIAFGHDKAAAEQRALAFCKISAGTDRQDACQIDKSICDVTPETAAK
jgi:hypothetical protein